MRRSSSTTTQGISQMPALTLLYRDGLPTAVLSSAPGEPSTGAAMRSRCQDSTTTSTWPTGSDLPPVEDYDERNVQRCRRALKLLECKDIPPNMRKVIAARTIRRKR